MRRNEEVYWTHWMLDIFRLLSFRAKFLKRKSGNNKENESREEYEL